MQMKTTGVVRKFDDLGRLVVPKEARTLFRWNTNTPIEFFHTSDGVFLREYKPGCIFCGEHTKTAYYLRNKRICHPCLVEFQNENKKRNIVKIK